MTEHHAGFAYTSAAPLTSHLIRLYSEHHASSATLQSVSTAPLQPKNKSIHTQL